MGLLYVCRPAPGGWSFGKAYGGACWIDVSRAKFAMLVDCVGSSRVAIAPASGKIWFFYPVASAFRPQSLQRSPKFLLVSILARLQQAPYGRNSPHFVSSSAWRAYALDDFCNSPHFVASGVQLSRGWKFDPFAAGYRRGCAARQPAHRPTNRTVTPEENP